MKKFFGYIVSLFRRAEIATVDEITSAFTKTVDQLDFVAGLHAAENKAKREIINVLEDEIAYAAAEAYKAKVIAHNIAALLNGTLVPVDTAKAA